MKKHIILSLGLAVMLPALTGCDDYLDKDPSKSSSKTITEASQLDALLASYSSLYSEYNYSFIAGDDYGLTPHIEANRDGSTSIDDLNVFTWSPTESRTGRLLWDGEFAKIFRVNLVLNNIDNVNGGEAEKANLKAEAHFVRAYSLFQLAVCHCLYPSAENAGDLGLPLKATTSFEESVARASLGETFGFIEADILEALKISKRFVNGAGTSQSWRGTTASVRAFAARYYLYMGDLDKAKQYADEVLAEYSELKDFNDPAEMSYFPVNETYTINSGTDREEQIVCRFPYTKVQFYGTSGFPELLGWKELLYARTMYYASWWFIPSQALLDTYATDVKDGNPDNDLRYRYFVVEDFGLRYSKRTDEGRAPGFCQFYFDNIISGPTVAEMMLIKAEVEARKGTPANAIALLNTLRKARIATEAYTDLPTGSKEETVKRVLEERRREMPLTMRWYDIKRYAYNDDPTDDVTINRPFYKFTGSAVLLNDGIVNYTLEPKSRHYAMPIPEVDILRADGQLVQNTY